MLVWDKDSRKNNLSNVIPTASKTGRILWFTSLLVKLSKSWERHLLIMIIWSETLENLLFTKPRWRGWVSEPVNPCKRFLERSIILYKLLLLGCSVMSYLIWTCTRDNTKNKEIHSLFKNIWSGRSQCVGVMNGIFGGMGVINNKYFRSFILHKFKTILIPLYNLTQDNIRKGVIDTLILGKPAD